MNPPLVSVVTPFLDAERFLGEAVESVLAQTWPRWELLLVDDGSTDGSTALAREYAAGHPGRIRCLEHEGHRTLGSSAARNLGLRHARGEYVAFLDADDVWLPPKLERQVAILEARPRAAMVYGATVHWHGWTGRPEDAARDFPRRLGVPPDTLVEPPALVPLFLPLKAQTPGTCGVLVRRSVLEEVGGFEDGFTGMFDDQVLFYKICLRAPVFVESGRWDLYRQHPDSLCHLKLRSGEYGVPSRPSPSYLKFYEWLAGYLAGQGITDRATWRALHRALRPYRNTLRDRLSLAVERRVYEARTRLRRGRRALGAALRGSLPGA